MPKFMAIAETVVKIWPFVDLQHGGHAPSWFFF